MNKSKYAKTIFYAIIVSVCVWYAWIQPEPVQAKSEPARALEVGRENPFAKLPQTRPLPQRTSQPVVEIPELFVETVKLKFLDVATLSTVIASMSSPYGSISADPKSNSLIICDTKENLARILTQVDRADTTPPEVMFVETVTLKFLKAENLKTVLAGISSQYGSIEVDDTTNSLIICDTKEKLEKIVAQIRRADKTPQQIMVEVVIVDVQLGDDTEIGINWDILSDKTYDIGYRQNFTTRLGSTIADADTIGNATAFNTTGGIGSDFSIISGTIRNVVALLQQKKHVEILASPRVMVVSGKTARIEATIELPYNEITDTAAGGVGALTSTKFKKVGVTLNVSAKLTEDNLIFLAVDSEQNVVVGESVTEVPIIDTRKTKSELLLKDSQLVVMGGLRRKERTKQTSQVPILGDIPLIGFLFKHTNTVLNNTELIVFLSPHIYKEGEPICDEAMAKFREIKDRPMLSLPNDRDAKKETLLKKIKILQNKKDQNVTKELLSALTSLEEILSQELQELPNEPTRALVDKQM